ncbi:mercury resistance system periplasmic binding protein MerP [Massilia endophytica]|uniref:mercury resistance system periplasmic binding protein MerP n=1 Tax=Massilia endophytica TaxID=2899220 RepID=UPI001E3C83AA|nr:mercury resistance system periplasmic binding protein MerP [Massilia endophytica]UGQ47390.1 mercury resistance system periplasmic binding protein MerP [Massilia endophytica]
MKKLFLSLLIALPIAAVAATVETVTLDVANMTCGTCPITVKKALEKVGGVQKVVVDYQTKTATVTFDSDKAKVASLTNATTNAGFPSTQHK